MSCQVQINTINQLKSKNIIDDFSFDGLNRILDRAEFDKLNEKYTAFAKAKYPNLVVPDGELLFSTNVVENEDWSRSTYRRDAKYRTYWAVPNKDLFAKLQVEFDKGRDTEAQPMMMRINNDRLKNTGFQVVSNGQYLNLTKDEVDTIYENYVNLMDRKREGKAVDREKFQQVFDNLQVFKSKNTYIFGEWDVKNNVFKGRLMSSPNIKELYNELDTLFANIDFVASVPEDIGRMLEKKKLYKLNVDKAYNFRGEDMIKNLYFSNEALVEKIFKTKADQVTPEQIVDYDLFFNYWSLIFELKKLYEQKNYDKIHPSRTNRLFVIF